MGLNLLVQVCKSYWKLYYSDQCYRKLDNKPREQLMLCIKVMSAAQ